MALQLIPEERDKIIDFIKQHVEDEGNCRVWYAMKQVMGSDFPNSIHLKEKIVALIIRNNEYTQCPSQQYPGDTNIFKNPLYKKQNIMEKNPVSTEIIKLIAYVFASVLITVATTDARFKWNFNNEQKNQVPNDTVAREKIHTIIDTSENAIISDIKKN